MAVGNSPPLNRAIRATYTEQDTLSYYDTCQITAIFLCNLMCDVTPASESGWCFLTPRYHV